MIALRSSAVISLFLCAKHISSRASGKQLFETTIQAGTQKRLPSAFSLRRRDFIARLESFTAIWRENREQHRFTPMEYKIRELKIMNIKTYPHCDSPDNLSEYGHPESNITVESSTIYNDFVNALPCSEKNNVCAVSTTRSTETA